jgi:hypothetical protein
MKFSLQIVAVVICGLVQTSVGFGFGLDDYTDDYDGNQMEVLLPFFFNLEKFLFATIIFTHFSTLKY